jgi:cobalt/nickel transport system permease protein
MHIHFLDPYQARSSPVHRLDARVKLILALAFILTSALVPPGTWSILILLLAGVWSAAVLAYLDPGYLITRAFLALPFVLAALPLLLTVPGEAVLPFQIGSFQGAVTGPGLERFISISLKSWISIQAAILLTATTTFPDLLQALRAIRIPRLLVAVVGLMWRYLFVLADEALRLARAREARSSAGGSSRARSGGTIGWRARVTGGMAGNLFVRSIERSDRIYLAMIARGYDGEIRGLPLRRMTGRQRAILAAGLGTLFLIMVLAALF